MYNYVHMIEIIMSGSYKYDKDKSNDNFLCPLCPEKFGIYLSVLIGEMRHY